MSKLSDSLNTKKYSQAKGHLFSIVTKRNIIEDRSTPRRRIVTQEDREMSNTVIKSLEEII